MSELGTTVLVATEAVVPPAIPQKPQPRLTVYAAVIVGIFFIIFVATFRFNPIEHPLHHEIRYSTRITELVLQWGLFYLAYRGIRASNFTLCDAMGRGISSGWDLWDYFVDGMVFIFLLGIATVLLRIVAPFRSTGALQPITSFHFVLAAAVAISAGYTEEIIFRGLLFQQFKMFWNPNISLLAQALIFAVAHGGNQSSPQFLRHFVAGCLLGHYAVKRNSLWPGIIGHVILDLFALLLPFIRSGHWYPH